MHDLIRIATKEIADFLSTHLPALDSQWWTTRVEDHLSYPQQQRVLERRLTKLEQLDFSALLRILDKNWYELSRAANLPREGRNWVKELQTVRNTWAHEPAEPVAIDDVFRDVDTLRRCLAILDAKRESLAVVEAASTATNMAAARGGGTASSEPPPTPRLPNPEHPVPSSPDSGGWVEVRDHVLWTKHIRGNEVLKADIDGLSERSQIDLEVDGCRGTWQKMNAGPSGRPTPGIKPLGPARLHWHTLVEHSLGRVVIIAFAPNAVRAATGGDEWSFENVWGQICPVCCRRFARALVVSTLEGQTLYRDAFRMFGVSRTETFNNLGREAGVMG